MLYKLPEDAKELHDKALVESLIQSSVTVCSNLGVMFEGFKAQGHAVFHAGIKVAENSKELKDLQMRILYTALLQPFFKYEVVIGKKKQSVVQYILMTSLKRSNEVMKFVLDTCQNLGNCLTLLEKVHADPGCAFLDNDAAKIDLGKYLKETGGAKWVPVILLALSMGSADPDLSAKTLADITNLNECIHRLQLHDIHERKPLLDGKTMCELYGIKAGKIVGCLASELFNFSVLNPAATAQEAKDYFMLKKDEFL